MKPTIYFLVFEDYEPLDLMGPVEILGHIPDIQTHFISSTGGLIRSHQGFSIATQAWPQTLTADSILVVPGGPGTRALIKDRTWLHAFKQYCDDATWCLSICTGAALLAAAGCLEGRNATSNKKAFDWVTQHGQSVRWQASARWVHDGKYYTSSGVSAGMDMTLAFIAEQISPQLADDIARHIEYTRQIDASNDPFSRNITTHNV